MLLLLKQLPWLCTGGVCEQGGSAASARPRQVPILGAATSFLPSKDKLCISLGLAEPMYPVKSHSVLFPFLPSLLFTFLLPFTGEV